MRRKFNNYPIGYIHIDLAEVWTDEGKLYLFVAIDRVSKFAFAELHERATPRIAADFLRRLIERVPYMITPIFAASPQVSAGATCGLPSSFRPSCSRHSKR